MRGGGRCRRFPVQLHRTAVSPEYARRAGPRVNPLLGVGVGDGCTGEPVLVAPG
jgi:hypothetical protein